MSAVRRDDGGLNPLAARARRVKVQSLASRLGQAFLPHLREYTPRDLAGAARAFGKLGCTPPGGAQRWFRTVLRASMEVGLEEFDACQLSSLRWGVAIVPEARPDRAWAAEAARCALQAVESGVASHQGMALMLWSLSIIHQRIRGGPSLQKGRAPAGEDATAGEDQRDVGTVGQVSNEKVLGDNDDANESSGQLASGSGLGASRGAEGVLTAGWLDLYLGALEPYLSLFEPRYISMVLTSVARVGHQPSHGIMESATGGCFSGVRAGGGAEGWTELGPRGAGASRWRPSLGPQGLSNVLWALARLNYRPPDKWLSCFMEEAEAVMPLMRGQEMAIMIWAMAVLKVREV